MKSRSPEANTTDRNSAEAGEASRLAPAVAGACTFLAGVWLTLSPFVLDHEYTGTGFDGLWNDALVGIALIVTGSARLVEPLAASRWSSLPPALGLWLIAAPFVLGYNDGTPAPGATTSDLAVGVFLLLVWLVISGSREEDRADGDIEGFERSRE
ncbi:hypothetical protein LCL61_17895 [Amycolatopsis coloradensis]|uniref:Uncharacterized protein n=1 Tax=Amycolatopsis coloradensis TaxID=76021 RepID=A0ACD5BDZ4_9PSEU